MFHFHLSNVDEIVRERLEAARREIGAARLVREARARRPSLPDRLLLVAGDFLIAAGLRLKKRSRPARRTAGAVFDGVA